ncbi:MAG TPA: spore coat U domain-containing protein [Nevskiaceae bacterium]
MNKFKTLLSTAAIVSSGLMVIPGHAATDTANMQVSIQITAACDIHSTAPQDINFGSVTLLDQVQDKTGTVSIKCTPGAPFKVGLSKGANGASADSRKMKSAAGDLVNYNLYLDQGHNITWADIGGGDQWNGTGDGTTQSHTVYARVPAQPSAKVGTYTDTVVATVSF